MNTNIKIILVNPSHPGNIGATARAMKTMSFENLRLVKPQREVNDEAIARAVGADDILHRAKYFEDLKSAIADCQLVIGTSARFQVPDVLDLPVRETAKLAVEAASVDQQVAILFGREHAGLSNEELALCHYHAYIPCNPDFSSLNLGAAVQVVCYELFVAWIERSDNPGNHSLDYRCAQSRLHETLATQHEIELLFEHLEKTLAELDFYDRTNPRRLMPKLRALFNRTQLLKSEVAILRGILTAVDAILSLRA